MIIENYQTIDRIDLDLGQVNVFIGANGSGKTNILEALSIGETEGSLLPYITFSLDNEYLKEYLITNLGKLLSCDGSVFDLDDLLDLLDWVDDIKVTPKQVHFKDYWTKEYVPAPLCGDAALYISLLSTLAIHNPPPRYLVDNFASNLNPRLARAFTRFFCKSVLESDSQVLLATHHPQVLDGLDLRDDRIRLFAVERTLSSKGKTRCYRVEVTEEVLKSVESARHAEGLTPAVLWLMGRWGGMPNLF